MPCVQVDTEGFAAEMEAQRRRSKDALKTIDLTADAALKELAGSEETAFVG